MKIVKLTEESYFGVFSEAEIILKSGGIVICPTDTVYGILGRADSSKTLRKIFALKKRPTEKALPVFVKDIPTARKYAYISDSKARFLEKVWPGKVTVIFHHKGKLSEALTAAKETLGLRMPDYKFLLELLEKIEVPLAQTSANISGEKPAQNMEEVKNYFSDAKTPPDLVIDAGELSGEPSTIFDFTGPKPVVLRTGLMSKNDFELLMDSMV